MKRVRKDAAWYNTRTKETDSILLESRLAIVRRSGPYPDPRAGSRLGAVYPDFQTTIL